MLFRSAVGVAGAQAKCEFVVKELGFDACVNYRAEPLVPALQKACPKGIDVYFDNVGGTSSPPSCGSSTRSRASRSAA